MGDLQQLVGEEGWSQLRLQQKNVCLIQYVFYLSTAHIRKHLKINADPGSPKCFKMFCLYVRNEKPIFKFTFQLLTVL